MKTWFITGTDTDAGKTVVTTALLQSFARRGWISAGYKPVASGAIQSPMGLRNKDALDLQQAANCDLPYSLVNPITFAEPTAPHIASELTGQGICFQQMSKNLHSLQQQVQRLLVEGAGGWLTPLSSTQTFADWVQTERLPVILVVGMKLGCINHALLTSLAIKQAGLSLAGWVANHLQPNQERKQEYLSYLQTAMPARFLGSIPYLPGEIGQQDLSNFLQLPD